MREGGGIISTLKSWNFEATEDIMTGTSFIPALWNIGILLHKQATLGKHFEPECRLKHMTLRIVFIEVLGIFTFGGGVVGNEEHGDKERLQLSCHKLPHQ